MGEGTLSLPKNIDRPTLVAIAVVAYALANLVHEGLGHGGACLLAGGRPLALSAIHFEEDPGTLDAVGEKWVAAGGTIANVIAGVLALVALRAARSAPATGRYFLWLFMTVNLLQAGGYWLFSGLGNIGDWANVIAGLSPGWVFRLGLAVLGSVAYCGVVLLSLRELAPFLGRGAGQWRRALPLTVIPYLAGGILYVAAGFLNPVGWLLVLISAAAASFGGASALAWMAQLLRNETRFPPHEGEAPPFPRSIPWLAAGLVVALPFVFVLGPGIRF
jgi:hypothetical protein